MGSRFAKLDDAQLNLPAINDQNDNLYSKAEVERRLTGGRYCSSRKRSHQIRVNRTPKERECNREGQEILRIVVDV